MRNQHSDERCYFVLADLHARLEAFVLPPSPLSLDSSETLAADEGLMIRLTGREALQEVAIMLRTIEQAHVPVSGETELPRCACSAKSWRVVTLPMGREKVLNQVSDDLRLKERIVSDRLQRFLEAKIAINLGPLLGMTHE